MKHLKALFAVRCEDGSSCDADMVLQCRAIRSSLRHWDRLRARRALEAAPIRRSANRVVVVVMRPGGRGVIAHSGGGSLRLVEIGGDNVEIGRAVGIAADKGAQILAGIVHRDDAAPVARFDDERAGLTRSRERASH